MRRSVPTEFGLYLWTAITTGARRGEVSALRESRFDFARQQVRVSTNYIFKQGNRIEKAPKDGEGRVLSLDLLTCELLRERFQRRRAEAQVLGVQVPGDAFAFSPDPAGRTLWNPDTMTHRYRRYARRVGIASSPKELRHYSATQLLAAGTDLNTVAGRLGHAEGSTTLKFYAQFTRPANQRAAAIIPSQLDGLRRKERVRELYPPSDLGQAGEFFEGSVLGQGGQPVAGGLVRDRPFSGVADAQCRSDPREHAAAPASTWRRSSFGVITRQAIRRGTFRSVKDLTGAIGHFIDAYNQRWSPFAWTKDVDILIAKIKPSEN